MLRQMRHFKAGQATFEYIVLLTVILFAFLVFQKYIARGLMGRWRASGESFGAGRQYDPNHTIACTFDFQYTNSWYDRDCYFHNNCDVSCVSIYSDPAACLACIGGCRDARCT